MDIGVGVMYVIYIPVPPVRTAEYVPVSGAVLSDNAAVDDGIAIVLVLRAVRCPCPGISHGVVRAHIMVGGIEEIVYPICLDD